MKAGLLCLALLVLGLRPPAVPAAVASRDEMVQRAQEYLYIELQTNEQMDSTCLHKNLDRSEYDVPTCDGSPPYEVHSADFLWHPDYLNGQGETFFCWQGMPYAFGSGSAPDQLAIQTAINECRGLGNHECHYYGNGCIWPGCTWSVGVDCSGSVCYAWGISYVNTAALDDPEYSVEISSLTLDRGSILDSPSDVGLGHVVLVERAYGGLVDILEATGDYPVYWEQRGLDPFYAYPYPLWKRLDSKHVADNQATDGVLSAALEPGGGARLVWSVERARDTRWYEFQFRSAADPIWHTFREEDFDRLRSYEAAYAPDVAGDAAGLLFRVREVEWRGRAIPHGETRAFPPNPRGAR